MPISREEFESSLDRPSYIVLSFLRSRMDAAYTAAEIVAELADLGEDLTQRMVDQALGELVKRQRIESSYREGELYYAYRRSIGFRR